MLPSGAAGKNYIEEVTRLMKLCINDTPLRKIALKAAHIMLHYCFRNHISLQNQKTIMLLLKEDLSYGRKGRLSSCSTKDKLYRKG